MVNWCRHATALFPPNCRLGTTAANSCAEIPGSVLLAQRALGAAVAACSAVRVFASTFIVPSAIRFGCIAIVLAAGSGSRASEVLRRRFMDEAPAAWRAIEHAALALEGSVTDVGEALDGLPASESWRANRMFKCVDGNMLFVLKTSNGPHVDRVMCINRDYAFSLSSTEAGGARFIRSASRDEGRVRMLIDAFGETFWASIWLDSQSLVWSLGRPGFVIQDVTATSFDGHEMIDVVFESSEYVRPDYQIKNGHFVVDPDRAWSLRFYEVNAQLDEMARVVGTIDYQDKDADIGAFPMPRRIVRDFRCEKVGVHKRRTFTFDRVEKCNAPLSEFKLSAFGFAEPNFGATDGRRSRVAIWFAVGCLGLITAYILGRRAARSSADSHPER